MKSKIIVVAGKKVKMDEDGNAIDLKFKLKNKSFKELKKAAKK